MAGGGIGAVDLFAELKTVIPGERVTSEDEVRTRHGSDFSSRVARPPDAVVFPKDRDEVVGVLRFANERRIPVVPFGQGSSVEGQVVPISGGISLDTGVMDRILDVRPEDFVARVQPGVTHGKLNAALAEHGLFFPPDPGWDASLGGMAATNASGSNALRYGAMRDLVLGLEVVLADGTVMRTGGATMKSSAGYNLTALFVGSEGTLGVFTELVLRLRSLPQRTLAARAIFSGVEEAAACAASLMRSGTRLTRVELVDRRTVEAVNLHKGTSYPEAASLFLDLSGDERGVERDAVRAREICELHGCARFDAEEDEAARARLWEARHEVGVAVKGLHPDKASVITDVCVPLSELPAAVDHARRAMERRGLDGAIVGHAGDGNYHAIFPVDPRDEEESRIAEEVGAEIVADALARGGTCTGEHGVGLGKAKHLRAEHGDSLWFMRELKRVADPNNIMNPGKIFVEGSPGRPN
jgi:D-lactate dehydrogenase (cytochrome)